jgi:hypothetical protein
LGTTTPSPGYRIANSTTQKKFDKSQLSSKSTQHNKQITTNFRGQGITYYLHATKKGEEKSDPYIITYNKYDLHNPHSGKNEKLEWF